MAMIEIEGTVMQPYVAEWNTHKIPGVVIDGDVRWSLTDIIEALFDVTVLSSAEGAELVNMSMPDDEIYSVTIDLDHRTESVIAASRDCVRCLVRNSGVKGQARFLMWLNTETVKATEKVLSKEDALACYLTPDYADFVRKHFLEEDGIDLFDFITPTEE